MVISVEKSQKHLTVFKHSAGLWDFTEQIMALQGDFLEMRLNRMRVDAVIVNFKAETIDLMKEKFCLFKHVKPNIRETLKKAAGISRKIMLILPKHVEIDEIALLFKDFAEFCKEKFFIFCIFPCFLYNFCLFTRETSQRWEIPWKSSV